MALTEKRLAVSKNSCWSCLGRIHVWGNWWNAVRVKTHLQPAQQLLEEVLGCRPSLSQSCLQGLHLLQTLVMGLLIFFMVLHHEVCSCTQVPLRGHVAIGQVLALPRNWKKTLSSIGIVSPADIMTPLLPLLTRFVSDFLSPHAESASAWPPSLCRFVDLLKEKSPQIYIQMSALYQNAMSTWVRITMSLNFSCFYCGKMDTYPSTYLTEMCPELNNWSIHSTQ